VFAGFFVDVAPMNSMMDPKPRSLHFSSVLSLTAIALLTASTVVGQRVFPSNSTNSNNAKRSHVATIRSADSSEGSRVSISSDQALTDYEAYRRGDKFYVKIPAADVPRAEAVRGRGFADVTAQRNGSSTTLAFRLHPGSTAHVQQNGNRLDVVIAVAGSNTPSESSRPRNFQWSDTSGGVRSANANNRIQPPRTNNIIETNANKRANQTGKKNSSARDNSNSPGNSNSKSKPDNKNSAAAANKSGNANSSTGLNGAANANSSVASNAGNVNSATGSTAKATPSPIASPSQNSINAANSAGPSPTNGAAGPRSDFWTRAKERGHYWLLLAQLNPIPVAVGAAILVLIIGLLLMQRRRAKATRRVRTVTKSKATTASSAVQSQSVEPAVPVAAAVAATVPETKTEGITETTRLASVPAVAAASDNGRKDRVSRAAEEASKVFAGEPYDESILGSDDRETRRMVGAELLSAMVGRNSERRDRARAAFMKHGYFDDATRDLRVASSDNERAAAARRLSFVQDREATPHLVGALSDPSPDVRRTAVEALMDQRDPAAIAPLNDLLQRETDRKVPRNLIEQAVEACATNSAPASTPASDPSAPPPPIDSDREVIEI
jgi:hypothetical protein